MEQKLSILNDMLPVLTQIRQPAELDMVVRHTADRLFLSEQAIKNEINAYRRSGGRRLSRSYDEQQNVEITQTPRKVDYPENEVALLNGMMMASEFCSQLEQSGGRQLFFSELSVVYEDFISQFKNNGQVDASRLEVEASSIFATAVMQHPDAIPEALSGERLDAYLSKIITEQQYKLLNRKYRTLLNKIGSLEKGGQSDDMEQALIELEKIRQKKTQFEDRMRGEKQ